MKFSWGKRFFVDVLDFIFGLKSYLDRIIFIISKSNLILNLFILNF